ncbi:hypothetical protein ACFX2J_009753 [Malus domestica]
MFSMPEYKLINAAACVIVRFHTPVKYVVIIDMVYLVSVTGQNAAHVNLDGFLPDEGEGSGSVPISDEGEGSSSEGGGTISKGNGSVLVSDEEEWSGSFSISNEREREGSGPVSISDEGGGSGLREARTVKKREMENGAQRSIQTPNYATKTSFNLPFLVEENSCIYSPKHLI